MLIDNKIHIPEEHKVGFSEYIYMGNAKRLIPLLYLVGVIEFLIFLYESFLLSGQSEYEQTSLLKLVFTIVLIGSAVLMTRFSKRENKLLLQVSVILTMALVCTLGVTNTFAVQKILPDITTFLLVVFAAATIVRIPPKISGLIFGVMYLYFNVGIGIFQPNADYVLWGRINGAISISVACLLSYILYRQSVAIYIEHQKVISQNEQLIFMATHDGLTKVFNHQKISEIMDEQIAQAMDKEVPLSIAVIDIDDFKLVNDTYGHKEGDFVIKKVSSIMQENIKETYSLGRYGGDEFLLIMPNTTYEEAIIFGGKLINTIANANYNVVKVTVSCGVIQLNEINYNTLIEEADKKMYLSKKSGKNQII